MTTAAAIIRPLTRSPLVAATLYLAVLGGFILLTGLAVLDILQREHTLAQTSDMLAQLQGRRAQLAPGDSAAAAAHPGAPFLEGPTVTVAGAALLQRVASAVTAVGGTIQSSQVDVTGAQARDGFVDLLISCDMEQPALQKLLYELEAGTPFLFVDQLDVQVPQAAALNDSGTGRIRVVLGVSGQWQAGK